MDKTEECHDKLARSVVISLVKSHDEHKDNWPEKWVEIIKRTLTKERKAAIEECAGIADQFADDRNYSGDPGSGVLSVSHMIAKEIRKLAQAEEEK
jgi:hypothetical protein